MINITIASVKNKKSWLLEKEKPKRTLFMVTGLFPTLKEYKKELRNVLGEEADLRTLEFYEHWTLPGSVPKASIGLLDELNEVATVRLNG